MKWIGLDQYRERLLALPGHLTAQAAPIVKAAAARALTEAQLVYRQKITGGPLRPGESRRITGTGNLVSGLRINVVSEGANGIRVRLRNNAPHAYLYEIGTRARKSRGRSDTIFSNRGRMPPGHVFVPAAIRARAVMYEQLTRMLEAEGLEVRIAA